MKTNLLLLLSLIATLGVAAQQFEGTDFEAYSLGALGTQSAHWTTWSGTEGGAEDGIVSEEQANSGVHSMLIAEGGAQDVVLLLNQTAGTHNLTWMMYVPANASGYYNFQGEETIGTDFVIEIMLNNAAAAPGIINFDPNGANVTATYPEDEWFELSHDINLDEDLISISLNGSEVYSGAYTGTTGNLSSIDFFSISATNRFFIDDVSLNGASVVGITSLENLELSLFPNPNSGSFNITNHASESDYSVVVRDVTGSVVSSQNLHFNSEETRNIELDELTTGMYLVEMINNDNQSLQKSIKMLVK